MELFDAITRVVILATFLVMGVRGTWRKARPLIVPAARAIRNWIVRDVLRRVDALEDRVTIVETRVDEQGRDR